MDRAREKLSGLADQILGNDPAARAATKTKRAIGLGSRMAEETSAGMSDALRGLRRSSRQVEEEPKYDVERSMAEWIASIRENTEGPLTPTEPDLVEKTEDYVADTGFVPVDKPFEEKYNALLKDKAFVQNLNYLKESFPGLSEADLFRVMQKESSLNPRAVSSANAVGLLQLTPDALADIGFTAEEVLNMAPAEQLLVYKKYLDRWNFNPETQTLGLLQAAPAYRNAAPETVVYKVGSAAWKQNPGWRSGKDGPITVASINDFYWRRK